MGRVLSAADLDGSEVVEQPQAAAPAAAPSPAGGKRILSADDLAGSEVVEGPSALSAASRGIGQGVFFNLADELVGAGRALTDTHDIRRLWTNYKRERDKERALDHEAEAAHPTAYNVGQIGGSLATAFVPGIGALKGAGTGAKLLRAGLTGALGGYGASEADTLGGQILDSAAGAAAGTATAGALHGVGKLGGKVVQALGRGAEKRIDDRVIDGIPGGAKAAQRDRVMGTLGANRPKVLDLVRDTVGLKEAALAKDSAKGAELVQEAIGKRMAANGATYEAVQAASPGVRVSNVLGKLEKLRDTVAARPGTRPVARVVDEKLNDILETWGNQKYVDVRKVRELASDLGPAAFKSLPGVKPGAGEDVGRKVYGALVGMIDDHVDKVNKAKDLGLNVLQLRETNQEIGTLINLKAALVHKAAREASPPTTLRSNVGKLVNAAGTVASLSTGNPLPYLATNLGPPGLRKLDDGLARLAAAARQPGSKKAEMMKLAATLGIPRYAAEKTVEAAGEEP